MKELRKRSEFDDTFSRGAWRQEAAVFYRQRQSIWFVLAVMIGLSAFWDDPWAYVAFFGILALYSAYEGVRIGFVCGASWALWFLVGLQGWVSPGSVPYRVAGLWCIATLFLLVVWKADEKRQLRAHQEGPV